MEFALGPRAAAAGHRLISFDAIGSTNDEALARLRAGQTGPLWFATDMQTSGRGRRQRPWLTPRGNLAASLLLVLDVSPSMAATLGFVAGLALETALQLTTRDIDLRVSVDGAEDRRSAPADRFLLKWPNDVLSGPSKVAGILLESEPMGRERIGVVVGIGVNVTSAPDGLPYPATSLAALGSWTTAPELFAALSDAWVEMQDMWDEGRGLAAIRAKWLERAAGIGGPVVVRVGNQVVRGVFETIDDEGRLITRDETGSRIPITAGEVHFGAFAEGVADSGGAA